jgi:hypothetical protein
MSAIERFPAEVHPRQRPAALPDLRQRRRRQEHPDRSPAVRQQDDPRRYPARDPKDLGQTRAGHRRPVAADRRPAGRARTGHHHRRRLSLLHHRNAQVHHRRRAGPRAIHAQHGHRRVDRRPGDHPDRRPQGRADPDPPPFLPGPPARHSAPIVVAVNKMDLVGLLARNLRADQADYLAFANQLGITDVRFIPMSALQRRHDRRSRRAPGLVRRADAARDPRKRAGGAQRARREIPLPGAVRLPPAGFCQPRTARLSRLHGPRRVRRTAPSAMR